MRFFLMGVIALTLAPPTQAQQLGGPLTPTAPALSLGAGVPSALANSANSNGGVTLLNGSATSGDCLVWGANGIQDAGSPCVASPISQIGQSGATVTFEGNEAVNGALTVAGATTLLGTAYSPYSYGAVCNGTTDDGAAFIAAGNAALAHGGYVQVPAAVCAVGTTGNVTLPGVEYRGAVSSYGYNSNYATAPYTLLLNPFYTINLSTGAALVGLKVYPQGLGQQASALRGAITAAEGFSGTALTISGVTDVKLAYVDINGFNLGINHYNSDRVHYDHVEGDDTNFRLINGCGDTCTDAQVEAWSFLASPYALNGSNSSNNPQFQSATISSFSNSGGLVEVALSAVPATPIVTGDTVIIGNTSATYEFPNGRWTVTAIDSQHFTLNGSTYASASATNEFAYITATMRKGYAFEFENTGVVSVALTDYGHDYSLIYGTGTAGMQCTGCWLDGDWINGSFADPVPVGLVYGATPGAGAVSAVQGAFYGGKIYDKGYSIYANAAGGSPLVVSNVNPLGSTGKSANVTGAEIAVVTGSVYLSNSYIPSATAGGWFAAVYDTATSLYMYNSFASSGAIYYQSATDCPKFTNNGEVLCPWTPTLIGSSGGLMGTGVGSYTKIQDQVTATFTLIASSLGTASGNVEIGGLPVASSSTASVYGNCQMSYSSVAGLASGTSGVTGYISPGGSTAWLNSQSNTTSAGITPAEFGSSGEIVGTCFYHD